MGGRRKLQVARIIWDGERGGKEIVIECHPGNVSWRGGRFKKRRDCLVREYTSPTLQK